MGFNFIFFESEVNYGVESGKVPEHNSNTGI